MKEICEFTTLRNIQERLLDKVLLILGIIAVPALLISILRYIDIGWHNAYFINMGITLVVAFVAVYRKTIPYYVKTGSLIAVFIVLAVSGACYTGLSSFYIPFLMLSILSGIIFLGRKKALYIYLAGAAIIIMAGILNIKGVLAPVTNLNVYHGHVTSWINALYNFSAITGLVILIIGEIGYILSGKIAELEKANSELKSAFNEIKTLQGILPICAKCKKIRDSNGYWTQVESYLESRSELKFSHGLCEKCSEEMYSKEKWFNKNKE